MNIPEASTPEASIPEAAPALRAIRSRRASAIERAGYAPVPRATPPLAEPPASVDSGAPPPRTRAAARTAARTAAEAPPRPGIVALVHDGRGAGVVDALAAGMAGALAGGDHVLTLLPCPAKHAAERLAAFLDRHRPAAVILAPPLADRDDLAALCHHARVACARVGAGSGFAADLVADERDAAASAVRRLVASGHVRIGLVAGPDGSSSAQRRELGYLDAMAERGLDRGPALIVPGDDSFESGIEAGRLLLEISPRPTAILASNDEMAAGVLHAASQAGVAVPAALSVIGFDDTRLAARTLPPLTSIRLPWQRIGGEIVHRMFSAEAAAEAGVVLLETELVERGSTAPPGQAA
ncbi:substrate-binding domain-containing protein [Novosphingobium resinovorum]|uniref:substrate-binding domain-containing protein n=1 Tax=Novosphingobium resinovorum TaxID=158500 RepID=UPI002ED567BE|nr:substrate-binding domain-containing protein [Novosphingobium resinovorum]